VLLKTYFGPFLANLETLLGRLPVKIKKNAMNFFCLEKNKNIFRKPKYVIPHQIFWIIRICFQNEKIFTKSGVISFLRYRAKIGTLASYKPTFKIEDGVKIFSKNS
jgi:hypothetical protein